MNHASLPASVRPRFLPPLEQDFVPAALYNRAFAEALDGSGVPLVIGLERGEGFSRFETRVFPEGHAHAERNLHYVERLVKFLLWQRGGYKVYIGGPRAVGEHIARVYAPDGKRAFDRAFMGE